MDRVLWAGAWGWVTVWHNDNHKGNHMNTLIDRISAALLLRIGLAIIFLYAAVGSLTNPQEWIGFLPGILRDMFPADLLLKVFSGYEALLVAWLLSGVYVRFAAILCAATLGGIVVSNFQLFEITFRDIALIFAALALAIIDTKEYLKK